MSLGRRTLQVVAFICTLVVGAASMAVIVTQTAWFKDWLRGFIVRQAEGYVNGRLSIGRLDGNLFFGVELEDVGVTMNGKTVVALKDVGIDYNFWTFVAGELVLDDIRLNQPVFHVERTADGWNIIQLIKARTPDPDEPKSRLDLAIGEIGVSDGTLLIESPVGTSGVNLPERIERLDASLGVSSNAERLEVDIHHVSLRAAGPEFGLNALSGMIRRTADTVTFENVAVRTEESSLSVNGTITNIESSGQTFNFRVSSDKLALQEIARILPVLQGYDLQPAFELSAVGPADRLALTFSARERVAGEASGDVTLVGSAHRRLAGEVAMRHLNIAPLLKNEAFQSDITGRGRIDLALSQGGAPMRGTYSLRAARASVAGYDARDVNATGRIDGRTIRVKGAASGYGGRATAVGTVDAGRPLRLDLEGRATHVDLRHVPAQLKLPRVPSDLVFDYRLSGRDNVFSGDVRLSSSTLAGATIAPDTTGTFRFGGGAPEYSAQGAVQNLDVQQIGRGFDIKTLMEERFKSRISGTFTVTGSGGGRYPLTLDASGVLADSELFGASVPVMNVSTRIADSTLQAHVVGQVDGLDPAVPTGQARYAGRLTGAVDVETTIRDYASDVTVDTFDAQGRVNLGRSDIGGLSLDTAVIDGRYAGREGVLHQLTMEGPDLKVSGSGPIALNENGASNLVLHLETPALERFADLIGQPLAGGAIVDATVTGNGRELKAEGTLDGSNVQRGNISALDLDTTFAVTIPDLTPEKASLTATSHATFVQIAGQKVNELTADTTYAASTVTFNATAKEGVREITAAGSALLHGDHQEVHLGNLSFRTQGVAWQTEPGSEATVQYGRERVSVKNVRLVSGDQRIEADGAIGSPGDALDVRMSNVDVAQLDQLLLVNHGLGGRLTANAVVTGAASEPKVKSEFTLAQGSFQKVTFESLTGTASYAGKGATVDVRLQQVPGAWLTAKGYVPAALFRSDEHDDRDVDHQEARPGEQVDLEIASSQIDLGVVQGFTSHVTNVTGALQANVKVTGSAHDPHLDGAIDIRGGAFTVPGLGTAYTGLDTRLDLKSDSISISEMRIVDEHDRTMTIGGTLAVHEREAGAVDITVQSENFEVIDNRIADLKLDTDLKITGSVRAPKVVGFVEVENGTIDVARILDQVTADPYTTEAVMFPGQASGDDPLNPPELGLFNAVELEVGIAVPSNLVLRGTDLRPANAPIDIGDVNATVGGAVQLRKAPGADLRLIGEVNTVRGSYNFQGRRFELLRDGRIRFSGTEEIDPVLDVRARRVIAGVETFVTIRGTLRAPELSFSSNPPQDEADILSLIVFNVPINELGEGQQISLAERAGALAGGYLASGLTESIASALELDEFEIQAVGESGLGPSLTVGEQVGEKLFVKLRQGFGSAQETEFILEYQISDFLRLQSSIAETAGGTQRATFRRVERGGIDLIFFFSF